jgi:hypothetical protein
VAVERAPSHVGRALPAAEPLDRPLERAEESAPKKIAYLDEQE